MRTTLELDDDLLTAAKQLAMQQGATVGQVISQLARQALTLKTPAKVRNGVPLFVPAARNSNPDLRVVNQLRDED
jgi:hypothetical protein